MSLLSFFNNFNQAPALCFAQRASFHNTNHIAYAGSVLLVVPDTAKKFARLLPIKELPGYIEFVEQGRLGDLITRRVYEQHLGADYEADRMRDMTKWIEALP